MAFISSLMIQEFITLRRRFATGLIADAPYLPGVGGVHRRRQDVITP